MTFGPDCQGSTHRQKPVPKVSAYAQAATFVPAGEIPIQGHISPLSQKFMFIWSRFAFQLSRGKFRTSILFA